MRPHASFLLLITLSSVIPASGQNELSESTRKALLAHWSESLYARSLSACIEAKALADSSSDNVVVLQNSVFGGLEPVAAMPSKIGSANIEYLTDKAVKERYKRLRKKFVVLGIAPIQNSGDVLTVDCAVYRVGLHKRKLMLGVSGGYMVHWRFDCSTGEYTKVKVEHWRPRID